MAKAGAINWRLRAQDQTKSAFKSVEGNMRRLSALTAGVGAIGAGAGVAVFGNAAQELEKLKIRAELVFGEFETGAQTIDRVRLVSQKFGLQTIDTARAYTRFAQSLSLAKIPLGDVNQLFEGVLGAAVASGQSAEQVTGSLLALEQVAAKGTVTMEELRRQLGDRIVGAMQVAADSMDMTTEELIKLVSSGDLAATEFLPRFARQLLEVFAPAAEKAALRMEAAFARLRDQVTLVLAEKLTPTIRRFADLADAVAALFGAAVPDLENNKLVATLREIGAQLEYIFSILNKLNFGGLVSFIVHGGDAQTISPSARNELLVNRRVIEDAHLQALGLQVGDTVPEATIRAILDLSVEEFKQQSAQAMLIYKAVLEDEGNKWRALSRRERRDLARGIGIEDILGTPPVDDEYNLLRLQSARRYRDIQQAASDAEELRRTTPESTTIYEDIAAETDAERAARRLVEQRAMARFRVRENLSVQLFTEEDNKKQAEAQQEAYEAMLEKHAEYAEKFNAQTEKLLEQAAKLYEEFARTGGELVYTLLTQGWDGVADYLENFVFRRIAAAWENLIFSLLHSMQAGGSGGGWLWNLLSVFIPGAAQASLTGSGPSGAPPGLPGNVTHTTPGFPAPNPYGFGAPPPALATVGATGQSTIFQYSPTYVVSDNSFTRLDDLDELMYQNRRQSRDEFIQMRRQGRA